MGKGSKPHRSRNNKKRQKKIKESSRLKTSSQQETLIQMPRNPKEIKTDILSKTTSKTMLKMKTPSSSGEPVPAIILNPSNEHRKEYETAWERMLEECHRQSKGIYNPATDDPDPNEDQGDGRDAFGNLTPALDDYPDWTSMEDKDVSLKLGELNDNQSKKTQVLVFRDHLLEFPELHLNVALLGPPGDTRGFPALLARGECKGAAVLEEADLAIFTGGPDVDPAYYGEEPVPSYYGDDERDYQDIESYLYCLEEGVPMLGVCRGSQLLAVMNGYKLVQDINNHRTDHEIWDKRNKIMVEKVSSLHHQAVIPGEGMEVLATAHVSTQKWLNPTTRLDKSTLGVGKYPLDVEAYFIRDTCCLGIQGHPEYKNYNAFALWTLNLINEYVILNEDIVWEGERRRVRKELREERKLITSKK